MKLMRSHLNRWGPRGRSSYASVVPPLLRAKTIQEAAMADPLDRNRNEEDVERSNEDELVDTADEEEFEEIDDDESADEDDAEDLE